MTGTWGQGNFGSFRRYLTAAFLEKKLGNIEDAKLSLLKLKEICIKHQLAVDEQKIESEYNAMGI